MVKTTPWNPRNNQIIGFQVFSFDALCFIRGWWHGAGEGTKFVRMGGEKDVEKVL